MDPQTFFRLSIGSLGIKIPTNSRKNARGLLFLCEFRLRGFSVQAASVPLISSSLPIPETQSNSAVFDLEDSDVKTLMSSGCFQSPQAYLEIAVFISRQGTSCGVAGRWHQIGTLKVGAGREWGDGKPAVLHSGWVNVGRTKVAGASALPELHLTVKLNPDPRYVFQFEDEMSLNPQIVQVHRASKQPIFSCKFIREKRLSLLDGSSSWSFTSNEDRDSDKRERKGWKVIIHDLSGSAVAAAFMATPFVPSNGCDFVQRSNPGSWLVVSPGPAGALENWHPWARLEAWREPGPRDFVFFKLHLLTGGQDEGILIAQVSINTEKGGEFFIDTDRPTSLGSLPQGRRCGSGEFDLRGAIFGGFVMNCRVAGEGKSSKPLVQLSARHVSCVEDAALFMALAAAVHLSVEACKPFIRTGKKANFRSSISLSGLNLLK